MERKKEIMKVKEGRKGEGCRYKKNFPTLNLYMRGIRERQKQTAYSKGLLWFLPVH